MVKGQYFTKLGQSLDKWFLSPNLKTNDLQHWKARLLVAIHLMVVVIGLILEFAASFLIEVENAPALRLGILLVVALMFVFRKFGNMTLSGNLLSGTFFLVLLVAVFESGGLFSDNLLWMVGAPLLALLFANRLSGFLWLLALVGFASFLFIGNYCSPKFFLSIIEESGSLYYLISYIGLFVMVVGIVLVFATGQGMIIRALDEKQIELEKQKEALAVKTESLEIAQKQLKEINQELEHFAYAASHDLKEPLRMIKIYTQFIGKRLSDNLDSSTAEYMGFVTEGVVRMERLLTDLLEYSRLGRNSREATDTNLNDILMVVINNLMATMNESKAAVVCNKLPVIKSTSTEMIQLFQNLISNSIKFRQSDVAPVIEIKHEMEEGSHHFYFHDNGIGIPPESCSKVFNIFERLHSKTEFEGTGIGLATCKKIVDNLGGKIWVEPGQGGGTTFQIVIPEDQTN